MEPPKEYIRKPKTLQRIVLYPKDVMAITGVHEQTARKMLKTLKEALGKSPWSFVTIKEFAQVFEIEEDVIQQFIK